MILTAHDGVSAGFGRDYTCWLRKSVLKQPPMIGHTILLVAQDELVIDDEMLESTTKLHADAMKRKRVVKRKRVKLSLK
jgi:hypothetical protein